MAATRWGILSAGKICHDFCAAMYTHSPGKHQILAVAARDKERAGIFANKFTIPRHYGSYEELVNDSDIDVVYIGTIPQCHKEACILALNAGKPVLTEGPMFMNERETREVIDLAKKKGIFLMEGIFSQCLPAYSKLRQELANIGEPQVVTISYGFNLTPWENEHIGIKPEGIFMTIANYAIMVGNTAFGGEPEKIVATGAVEPLTNADVWTTLTLHYSKNRFATFVFNSEIELSNEAMIYGSNGWIKLPENFVAPTKLITNNGEFDMPLPETKYNMNFDGTGGLVYIQDHVRECIKMGVEESPLVSLSDSLQIASIVEEARRQVRAED